MPRVANNSQKAARIAAVGLLGGLVHATMRFPDAGALVHESRPLAIPIAAFER